MQLLSLGAQYAVSAMIALSRVPEGKAVPAADLARPLHCPSAYLSQTLAKLVPVGLIDTKRGVNGGVFLARKAGEISLYDIISTIDGDDFFETCFLGIRGCGHVEPCPFHYFWKHHRDGIRDWMRRTTLEDARNGMSDAWFDLRLNFK